MSWRVQALGPTATEKLEEAIAASGCKDEHFKLATFLVRLKKRKAPEGLSLQVQRLPGQRVLITYEDCRFTPKHDGYALLQSYSSPSERPVRITWQPTYSEGRLYISPELDLGLEVKSYHDSGYDQLFGSLVLEVWGCEPVLLGGDFSACVSSAHLPKTDLRRLVDTYFRSAILLVGLDDAIALAEDYLSSLREIKKAATNRSGENSDKLTRTRRFGRESISL